jgi:hypothetical protein
MQFNDKIIESCCYLSLPFKVGPPPGLESMAPKASSEPAKSTRQTKSIAPKSNRYETRFMLALSASPLVGPPDSMPALNQWYG